MTTDNPKPLIEHLIELRARLVWVVGAMLLGAIVSFCFAESITGFLIRPLAEAMQPGDSQRLIYTGLTEAFFTYVKVAFFAGLFITFPVLLWQIW
ncbi:MAG TPA: twin-arginine translocase subunit TatC, partial [Alphaproteobacteria bacterium]|nr:twin-arginine translocase subunit TatC [Alphaproteobacteria bacterium]